MTNETLQAYRDASKAARGSHQRYDIISLADAVAELAAEVERLNAELKGSRLATKSLLNK